MRFADEIVPHSDIDAIPRKSDGGRPKELKLATQLIDSLAIEWDPGSFHDTYTNELRDLRKRKASGEQIVVDESAPAKSKVIDLMAALEASLDAAQKAKSGKCGRRYRQGGQSPAKSGRGHRRRRTPPPLHAPEPQNSRPRLDTLGPGAA